MRWFATLLAFAQLALMPTFAQAQEGTASRTVVVESWEEEWDPNTQSWVRIEGSTTVEHQARDSQSAARYALPTIPQRTEAAIAQYGPFQVTGSDRAALVGPTGPMSPQFFRAMLRDFPDIATLDMVEAPGTSDDLANLAVGRMIRAHGIATHVPNHGSVRSGAVELFLAGAQRSMDDGARFAVHSWLDHRGREPQDFAADAPENMLYLDYYRDMGMERDHAEAFYAMTNSVPHHSVKWLGASEMRSWLQPQVAVAEPTEPVLAYADVSVIGLGWLDS